MYKFLFLLSFLLVLLTISCSNSADIVSAPKPSAIISSDSIDGFLRIEPKKNELVLGTDDSQARTNERPQMNVYLTM